MNAATSLAAKDKSPTAEDFARMTPREVRLNVGKTRSAEGRTMTFAEPERDPSVAVTVPLPSVLPARKVTAPPSPRTTLPSVAGWTVHERLAGTAFPKPSAAAAVNATSPRARTSREDGVTATRAAAPATTVTSRVACVVPGAVAVKVACPARVSR